MPDVLSNLPRHIAELIADELRERLGMNDMTCYVAAAPLWVEGGPYDKIVQICVGESRPWGGGDGAQEGGNIFREQTYTIALWFVVAMDAHQMTDHALLEATDGILDYTERVFKMMSGAWLGLEQQCEQMRYKGESQPVVMEQDKVILMRTITCSIPYAVPLVTFGESIGWSTST